MRVEPGPKKLYKVIDPPRKISDLIQKIPGKYRTFAEDWYVHEKYILYLLKAIKKARIAVDISAIPEYIRSQLVDDSSARDVLFITSYAPQFIIDGVWKILARRYHPDNQATGDPELFRRYSEAYQQLKGTNVDNRSSKSPKTETASAE